VFTAVYVQHVLYAEKVVLEIGQISSVPCISLIMSVMVVMMVVCSLIPGVILHQVLTHQSKFMGINIAIQAKVKHAYDAPVLVQGLTRSGLFF
jgi:hypothetical protein